MKKDYNTKQVIVWRHDLKVRKGKIAAQAAHASLAAFLELMKDVGPINKDKSLSEDERVYQLTDKGAIRWLDTSFAKICVYVESEKELMEIYAAAKKANLPVSLITDSGRTEFKGVPTKTCLAIGPAESEEIDKITGHLKLL